MRNSSICNFTRMTGNVRHARRILTERAAAGQDMKAVHELPLKLDINEDQRAAQGALDLILHRRASTRNCSENSSAIKTNTSAAGRFGAEMEDGKASGQTLARFATMAADGSSAPVRLYLASAFAATAGRRPLGHRH